MSRLSSGLLWGLCLCGGFAATPTWADTLFALRVLREGGCGGALPAAQPLHHNAALDRAAAEWAAGSPLSSAAEMSGYRTVSTAGLHVQGGDEAVLGLLRRSGCSTLANPGFEEVGYYRRGMDTWVVLASRMAPAEVKTPPAKTEDPGSTRAPTPILAARALQLVNDVRARGIRCGDQLFGPAPPMALSVTLASVAFGHASDMALHNYFEHLDLAGQSPADRVRAVGYPERLVGENIAYGPKSIEEVVKGWLDSPGHCENIMDPRFAEMGIGYAIGRAGNQQRLYWVQVLAQPKV